MQPTAGSMVDSAVDRSTQRAHARVLFSVPIVLHHLVAGARLQRSRGMSLDISEGGLGAIVQGDLRVGEAVQIELAAAKHIFRALAVVRYSSSARSGFEFFGLGKKAREQLAALTERR